MANDHGLRKIFRDNLRRLNFDVIAIETRGVSTGAPDTNYCGGGIEGWVEHKRMEHGRVTIRPAQVGWIERRLDHGGRVFVAVRYQLKLWLFHGSSIRQLQTQKVEEVAHILHYDAGPGAWNWPDIAHTLTHWKPLK